MDKQRKNLNGGKLLRLDDVYLSGRNCMSIIMNDCYDEKECFHFFGHGKTFFSVMSKQQDRPPVNRFLDQIMKLTGRRQIPELMWKTQDDILVALSCKIMSRNVFRNRTTMQNKIRIPYFIVTYINFSVNYFPLIFAIYSRPKSFTRLK